MTAHRPLIVALDTADEQRLALLAAAVGAHAGCLKVGLEAFVALGRRGVDIAAQHGDVFLDLKLHDIPNTVAGAAAAAARLPRVRMLTVHAAGGADMIRAAVEAAPHVHVLAVTVLTSLDDGVLAELGHPPVAEQVPRLARLAIAAGASGVVCAPTDVAAVRAVVGASPLLVVPGIRRAAAAADDQARVATAGAARRAGADYLVVGRPVTAADDPAAAARAFAEEAS